MEICYNVIKMQHYHKIHEQRRLSIKKETVSQKNTKTDPDNNNISQVANPREAFIKRLQKKFIKNQIEQTGANDNQKSSSQTINEEIFKSHLAKVSYLANRRSQVSEKKPSTFHNYLLKDLCDAVDNPKANLNTTQPVEVLFLTTFP